MVTNLSRVQVVTANMLNDNFLVFQLENLAVDIEVSVPVSISKLELCELLAESITVSPIAMFKYLNWLPTYPKIQAISRYVLNSIYK